MINYNNLRISLDRKEQHSDVDFISHAHTDHLAAAKTSKMVLASTQTVQLIEQAQNITIQNKASEESFKLIEAGHMLGSRQLYVKDDVSGKNILYTGDFQTVKSKTSKPIDIVNTDILIMDSTYENPLIKFNDKYEVESEMQDWTTKKLEKGIVLYNAYALGKAQELVALFNDVGIIPMVSKKISRVCKVYQQNGIKLDYCSAYDESNYNEIIKGNFVGITEARDLQTFKAMLKRAHNKNVWTAVATGWAKVFRFGTDAQFALSDHADFDQSVQYINATEAKEVFTYGGNADQFARNLERLGYSAKPFSEFRSR